MPEVKEFDEQLRARLQQYREEGRERPLTMADIAQEMGVSSTVVNKYLAGKPEGDVVKLERLVADMLKAASKRQNSDVPFFRTNVTDRISATFELIRKTNDVGLIFGPAGVGKSITIAEYTRTNATTLAISVPRWQRNDSGASPPTSTLEWSDEGVDGSYRFLKRLWNYGFTFSKNSSENKSDYKDIRHEIGSGSRTGENRRRGGGFQGFFWCRKLG
jgi:transcriptional regulator with XRE-family HTH domain